MGKKYQKPDFLLETGNNVCMLLPKSKRAIRWASHRSEMVFGGALLMVFGGALLIESGAIDAVTRDIREAGMSYRDVAGV